MTIWLGAPLDIADQLEKRAGTRSNGDARMLVDAAAEIRKLREAVKAKRMEVTEGDVLMLRYDAEEMTDGDLWAAVQYLRKEFPDQQVIALPLQFSVSTIVAAKEGGKSDGGP